MVPTLLILSALVFLSVRFIPGDIIDAMEMRTDSLRSLDREQLERILGIDQPIHIQYVRWLGDILLRGTLGDTLLGKDTVEAKIWRRVGPTFQLGLMALSIAMVIALPVGIYSAIRQDTAGDYAGRTVAVLGLATPNFWLALMVIIYPACGGTGHRPSSWCASSIIRGRAWAASSSPASSSEPPSRQERCALPAR